MNQPKVALVTCAEAIALDDDMPPLVEACTDAGIDAQVVNWDDARVDWRGFAAAVLRSTWDYVPRLPNFLAWAESASRQTTLLNSVDVVRWNTDKHYLADLANAGVPVVPTCFVRPGDNARAMVDGFLSGSLATCGAPSPLVFDEFVVKPSVGAGSKGALRLRRGDHERARLHLEQLLIAGRSVMLQPYLIDVDTHGETAAIYIDGRFSHSIRKGPLLHGDGGLIDGLFAVEEISAREASREEGRVAKLAFNAIPFRNPLYARIDLIRDAAGNPLVLELELVEPSLFFAHGQGSAARFATALRERVAADHNHD